MVSSFKHICGCGNKNFELHYDVELNDTMGFIIVCTKCEAQYYFTVKTRVDIEEVQGIEFREIANYKNRCMYCGVEHKKDEV